VEAGGVKPFNNFHKPGRETVRAFLMIMGEMGVMGRMGVFEKINRIYWMIMEG